MDRIRELIANLTNLSAEELAELRDLIDAEFTNLEGAEGTPTAETVAAMDELVDAAESVMGEQERREVEAQEIADRRSAAAERMKALKAKASGETEGGDAGDGETGDESETEETEAETPASGETEHAPAETPAAEPVTASGGTPRGTAPGSMVQRMSQAQRGAGARPENGPEREPARAAAVIVAAAGLDVAPGTPFTDSLSLGRAMSDRLLELQATHTFAPTKVASARWTLPEDRQLTRDADENTRKIEAVVGLDSKRVSRRNGALVATGGICLPVNVDYSVPTWSTADRPLRDALPAFQATRGGIQFVAPPDIGLSSLQAGGPTGAGSATGVWTEATDANPAGATKPVWTVACGAVVTAYVDAIPTRVQFGNMQSRFAPEQIAANTQQAIAAAARTAELNLLERMFAASKQVKPQQYLGATRDLMASISLLSAQYRYSHRLGDNVALSAVFPSWVKNVIRSDMARELAHDNTNGRDVLAISDAQIDDWFDVHGVNPIWTLDALPAGTYGTGATAIPNQGFGIATAGSQPQWPGQTTDGAFVMAWLLFVEGTYQYLDGGRLDLGVVRDSILDATNDYETFVETFEGIAFRGLEVYQVQQPLLPTGGSGGSVAPSSYHE